MPSLRNVANRGGPDILVALPPTDIRAENYWARRYSGGEMIAIFAGERLEGERRGVVVMSTWGGPTDLQGRTTHHLAPEGVGTLTIVEEQEHRLLIEGPRAGEGPSTYRLGVWSRPERK